jgi:hypothetical protein
VKVIHRNEPPRDHKPRHLTASGMDSYEKVLEGILNEVSFGYETIRVYREPGLQALQIGYSIGPTGEPLTGEQASDWQTEWIVIGYEECSGDPIFIDSLTERFPVYTAIHGEGSWEAKQIAVSLDAFGRALSAVAAVANGRENPVALESNPLTQSEKQTTLAAIQSDNPGLDLEFWEILLS